LRERGFDTRASTQLGRSCLPLTLLERECKGLVERRLHRGAGVLNTHAADGNIADRDVRGYLRRRRRNLLSCRRRDCDKCANEREH